MSLHLLDIPDPTPLRVRATIEGLGWTLSEAARRLEVDPKVLKRYVSERHVSRMPRHTWLLLLLIAGNHPTAILAPRVFAHAFAVEVDDDAA